MPPKTERTCEIPGCGRPHNAKGYCKLHYRRHQRGQDLNAPSKPRGGSATKTHRCGVEDCTDPHWARGFCRIHYREVMSNSETRLPLVERHTYGSGPCAMPHCRYTGVIWEASCPKHYKTLGMYSLTVIQYAQMALRGCQLCGSYTQLSVDHDHACCPGKRTCGGCTRGVLCRYCNMGLGSFKDQPELLILASEYLSCYTRGDVTLRKDL